MSIHPPTPPTDLSEFKLWSTSGLAVMIHLTCGHQLAELWMTDEPTVAEQLRAAAAHVCQPREEAAAPPKAPRHIISHWHDGDQIRSLVACREPEGAFCRLTCDCDEDWAVCDLPCERGCQHEPDEECLVEEGCNHPGDLHCLQGHLFRPCECWIVENLEAYYGGNLAEGYEGPADAPVHAGPIVSWRTGGHQAWKYWEAAQ